MQSHRRVLLPADYVARHVQLGYACTVHSAQGQTVDTSHTVLTGSESQQLLYVALTRGQRANSLYLDASVSGDDVVYAEGKRPPTAVEMLTRVVERDDSAVSASSARREERDPVSLLRKACAEYADALGVAAECVLGPEGLARIAARADDTVPGITDWPAWPALNTQLQRLVLDDVEPYQVLHDEAVLVRAGGTHDLAAVLAARLDAHQRISGPLPWLPSVPRRLTEADFWSLYLDRRQELIQRHGTAVRAAATRWTAEKAPAWTGPMIGDPDLIRDIATWRAAREIPDTDLRPTGPPANGRASSRHQRQLDGRLAEAGGAPIPPTGGGPAQRSDPPGHHRRTALAEPRHRSPRPNESASTAPSYDAWPPADRCRSKSPPPPSRTASSMRSANARRRRCRRLCLDDSMSRHRDLPRDPRTIARPDRRPPSGPPRR